MIRRKGKGLKKKSNDLSSYFFFNKCIETTHHFLFIYLFLAALGLRCCVQAFLSLQRAGVTLHCGVRASHCGGFSCCRAWALGAVDSAVVARRLSSCGLQALKCRLSSCGTWA